MRLVIDDLSLPLTQFNAKDSRPYLVGLQHRLSQSAQGFLNDVMPWAQDLPEDFMALAMLDPEGLKAAQGDIHQYLKATLLTPKGKRPTKARKSTKKAATKVASVSTTTRKSRKSKAQSQQYDLLQLAEFDTAPSATSEAGVTTPASSTGPLPHLKRPPQSLRQQRPKIPLPPLSQLRSRPKLPLRSPLKRR